MPHPQLAEYFLLPTTTTKQSLYLLLKPLQRRTFKYSILRIAFQYFQSSHITVPVEQKIAGICASQCYSLAIAELRKKALLSREQGKSVPEFLLCRE